MAAGTGRRVRRIVALLWIVAVYAALVVYGQVNEVAATLAVIGGAYGVSVALHELGHAVVALAMKTRIHLISVGWGPLLGSASIGFATVELRAVPSEGRVEFTAVRPRAIRLRMIATSMGGPAVNLAVIAGVVVAAPEGLLWPAVALTNAWLAVCSLLPVNDPQRGIRTDGFQILRYLFGRRRIFEDILVQSAYYEAESLHRRGRDGEALDLVEQAAPVAPDDADFDIYAARVGAALAVPALEAGRAELSERLARHALRRLSSGEAGVQLRTVLASAILDRTTGQALGPDDPRILAALEYAQTAVSAGGGEAAELVLHRIDLLREAGSTAR